jgi:hypothetical protein
MPTTTDDLRATMQDYFGDPIDDTGPLNFLFAHGYTDDRGMLLPPTPSHTVSEYEWNCIEFLFQEWDYAYNVR